MPAATGVEHDVKWDEGTEEHTAREFDVTHIGAALVQEPALLHRKHAEKYSGYRNIGHGTGTSVSSSCFVLGFFLISFVLFSFCFHIIKNKTQST